MHGEHTMKYQEDNKRELIRSSICIEKELMDKVDEYSKKLCTTRSATIAVLINQAFDYQEQMKAVNEFNKNFGGYLEELKSIAGGLKKGATEE